MSETKRENVSGLRSCWLRRRGEESRIPKEGDLKADRSRWLAFVRIYLAVRWNAMCDRGSGRSGGEAEAVALFWFSVRSPSSVGRKRSRPFVSRAASCSELIPVGDSQCDSITKYY